MHKNAGQAPDTTAEGKKKKKIYLSMKGGPFDYWDFEIFLWVCKKPMEEDEPNPFYA